MHGSVFLDASGEVIRPALLWNDQRTAAECHEIEQKAGGREALVRLVANPALTGFTAPKLLWVRKHEPKNWDRVRQVLLAQGLRALPADRHVRDRGQRRVGHALARRGQPPLEPRAAVQARDRPGALAAVLREPRGLGQGERARVRRRPGLPVGVPVVGGGGDQPAGAVGNGIVRQGVVSATMGTSGVVFAHADSLGFDPLGRLQRGCHAVPGAWHVMGVVLSAGGSFQWFRNELGKAEVAAAKQKGEDPYFLLTDEAALAGPGAEGLFFLPYLTGERTPHFDPDAKGAWVGLTVRHGRAAHDPQRARRSDLRDARQPRADPRDGRRDRASASLGRRSAETHSGGRSRPISTAATSTRSTRPRARPSASPCWPRSERAASSRFPRRATRPSGRSIRPRSTREPWRFTTARTRSIGSSTSIFAARSRRSAGWSRKDESEGGAGGDGRDERRPW